MIEAMMPFLENLNFAFDECKVQMSLLDCSDGAKKGMGIIFSKVFIFRWTAIFSFLCEIAMKTKKNSAAIVFQKAPDTSIFYLLYKYRIALDTILFYFIQFWMDRSLVAIILLET
jgi:hypothetical protein